MVTEQEGGQNVARRQFCALSDLRPEGGRNNLLIKGVHGGGRSWKMITLERVLVNFAIKIFHF